MFVKHLSIDQSVYAFVFLKVGWKDCLSQNCPIKKTWISPG